MTAGSATQGHTIHAYYLTCIQTVEEHVYEALSPYQVPASKQESLYVQLSSYKIRNISRENLTYVGKHIVVCCQFGSCGILVDMIACVQVYFKARDWSVW